MIVRAASKASYEIIEGLARDIWSEHYSPIIGSDQVSYMLGRFQSAIAIHSQVEQGMEYFLLLNQGAAIGYFAFQERDDCLFISKLYVCSTVRGQGIAAKALTYIGREAQLRQKKVLKLTVNKDNAIAIVVYQKKGFRNAGSVVQDIGQGYVMDDYVMIKDVPVLGD